MADPSGQDPVTEDSPEVTQLKDENSRLTQQAMLLDSMLSEFRQALADAQFALSKSNAQLKLSNQPTA